MRTPVPPWLRDWLGLDPAGAGEGTVFSVNHAWPWPPGLSLVLVGGAVALICWLYARERGDASRRGRLLLATLRLAALAVALFMLAEVVLSFERTGLPPILLLVDDSLSMSLVDRDEASSPAPERQRRVAAAGFDAPSRWNQARTLLVEDEARWLRRLERSYRLKLYRVGESVREQAGDAASLTAALGQWQPEGAASRLGEGLREVLGQHRGSPPSAVILLSDGVTSEGESWSEAAALAQRRGVPVFAVGLGSETPLQDLRLSDLLVDEVVFVDDVVHFQAKLTAHGFAGQGVELVLRRADRPEPLARTEVTVNADGQPQNVRLSYRPDEVGQFDFVVEAVPREGELDAENNRQQAQVSVRREKVRVLLVEAYPNYEFRFLKNLLERDETIELNTVLQEADPEYTASDRTALKVFPSRRETLFEYDVIILGDVNPAFFSATTLENVRQFVAEKGGGLVALAGPRYMPWGFVGTPLAEVLPVDLASGAGVEARGPHPEPFQAVPTELGLATPPLELGDTPEETREIWRGLAPFYWWLDGLKLKPGAMVLAEHARQLGPDGRAVPLVMLAYVGPGKVVFHATDETWRWRFQVGDVYFARYWVQTIRYLSRLKLLGGEQGAELTVDRREYRRGETVRFRVRFADERQAPADDQEVTVVVESPGRPEKRLALGRNPRYRGLFEGELAGDSLGSFHVWLASPPATGSAASADYTVVAPPGELSRTALDWGELSRAAELTGGRAYRFETAAGLVGDLPPGRQVPIEALPPVVLWNRWPVILALVLLLACEWGLRKWQGML